MLGKHLIDLNDLSNETCMKIIRLAGQIIKNPRYYEERLHGRILATLFYEPSTRTQMSFQAAMYRLGGRVIGFDNPLNSSVAKGENIQDTARIIGGYADLTVVRHPKEGAAKAFALQSHVPVINAGDGGHLHPTQTLTDLVTLFCEVGRFDHLTIGMCGDLKNGRTVHSLLKYMSQYPSNRFVLIATKELRIPDYLRRGLDEAGCSYCQVSSLEEAMGDLDILYMTRIQKERFLNEEDYLRQSTNYILDAEKMRLARDELKILHPLPRVDEIAYEVDDDPRALYFKQAVYGMYGRMALLITLLEQENLCRSLTPEQAGTICCPNENCITKTEQYLRPLVRRVNGHAVCGYCDHSLVQ